YGRLSDKFGDNGIVSIIIGTIDNDTCTIDTWLMSCRVLKRQFENAMFDNLLAIAKKRSLKKIVGVYKPTKKNKMVQNLLQGFGFKKETENDNEVTWSLEISNAKTQRTILMEVSHD
ncbi:hydrolase, partial [Candidatus Marinamargulisbacteria bacterium SCGC AAA071-K20]